MGRVKNELWVYKEDISYQENNVEVIKRERARKQLGKLKKDKPELVITPEQEKNYIDTFVKNMELWLD